MRKPAEIGDPESRSCANCGSALAGCFCAACGQEDRNLARTPLRELLQDWLGDTFAFDSRLLRTLGPLLTKPGFLTLEYLAGRRVAYVPPLRLFLFVSVVAILLLGLSGATLVRKAVTADGDPADLSSVLEEAGGAAEAVEESTAWQRFSTAEPAELNEMFLRRVPQALFVVAPLFGAMLWLIYRRVEPFYVPHLILSLHFHTFAFLVITAATLSDLLFEGQPVANLVLPVLAVYLFLTLRRVYQRGRLATATATLGLGVLHSIVWVVAILAMLVLTLAWS